jgi:hypothetical protein
MTFYAAKGRRRRATLKGRREHAKVMTEIKIITSAIRGGFFFLLHVQLNHP